MLECTAICYGSNFIACCTTEGCAIILLIMMDVLYFVQAVMVKYLANVFIACHLCGQQGCPTTLEMSPFQISI